MDGLQAVSTVVSPMIPCSYLLAAEVSTLGGIALVGFKKPEPFVGFRLCALLGKDLSGGGVAAESQLALGGCGIGRYIRSPAPLQTCSPSCEISIS